MTHKKKLSAVDLHALWSARVSETGSKLVEAVTRDFVETAMVFERFLCKMDFRQIVLQSVIQAGRAAVLTSRDMTDVKGKPVDWALSLIRDLL